MTFFFAGLSLTIVLALASLFLDVPLPRRVVAFASRYPALRFLPRWFTSSLSLCFPYSFPLYFAACGVHYYPQKMWTNCDIKLRGSVGSPRRISGSTEASSSDSTTSDSVTRSSCERYRMLDETVTTICIPPSSHRTSCWIEQQYTEGLQRNYSDWRCLRLVDSLKMSPCLISYRLCS
jgi:hypothetical protein